MEKKALNVANVHEVVSSAGEGEHEYWNKPSDKSIIVTHQECTHVGPRAVAALLDAGYSVSRNGREVVVKAS